jgi:hypothetical protein
MQLEQQTEKAPDESRKYFGGQNETERLSESQDATGSKTAR